MTSTKWTLVTGGAKNLGKEICLLLAKQGHAICVHYNKSKLDAERCVRECKAFNVEADLIQASFDTQSEVADFIKRYKARFANTKYLINNVGHYVIKNALETSLQETNDLFQTNFFTPYMLSQALIETIKEHQGAIVNIGTSGLQCVRADVRSSVYSASKLALWSLTKSYAKELAPFGVRVNMVSPGRLENSIDMPKSPDTFPMKRAGQADEVARVVAFLLDDKNSYITGQNIEVAGAISL